MEPIRALFPFFLLILLKNDVDFSHKFPYEGLISLGTLLISRSLTFYTVGLIINNEIYHGLLKKCERS
jgi:hypothetical protein